jgi:hypothetical protein
MPEPRRAAIDLTREANARFIVGVVNIAQLKSKIQAKIDITKKMFYNSLT